MFILTCEGNTSCMEDLSWAADRQLSAAVLRRNPLQLGPWPSLTGEGERENGSSDGFKLKSSRRTVWFQSPSVCPGSRTIIALSIAFHLWHVCRSSSFKMRHVKNLKLAESKQFLREVLHCFRTISGSEGFNWSNLNNRNLEAFLFGKLNGRREDNSLVNLQEWSPESSVKQVQKLLDAKE